jgi:DNA-binding beta-propeller fold protein YncE
MMIRRTLGILSLATLFAACKHTPQQPGKVETVSNYPVEVEKILIGKCASCHNEQNQFSSGGIRLDTWEQLFEGGSNGAVVIPYDIANSSLLYFININQNLGPVAYPTMPYDPEHAPNTANPLTQDEYLIIRDWVAAGAPDKNGKVPFAANASGRQKIYITMQSCDLVGVVDAERRVLMRYIPVGKTPATELPHNVRVDPSGRYAYVSFYGGNYVQKIDTDKDSVIAEAFVGTGNWNIVQVTPDGNKLMVTDWNDNGKAVLIDAASMTVEQTVGNLSKPHGIASNPAHTFFVTSEVKNVIYKFSIVSPFFKEVNAGPSPSSLVIHEIVMTPDYSRYFVSCQATGEVRVFDANADTLIKMITVGHHPQEIALSKSRPYMFVTCMEDSSSVPGYKGSVYAINYNTYETTRIDGPFYQPHGITVDDQNGTFYVVSRNFEQSGPAPHHSSACGGRNGYYSVYDLNTFKRLPRRYEVSADPYSAETRFK